MNKLAPEEVERRARLGISWRPGDKRTLARAKHRKRNRRYRQRLMGRGLTSYGTVRKNKMWQWPMAGTSTAARTLQSKFVRHEFIKQGLNWRGQMRQRRRWDLGDLKGAERRQVRDVLRQREKRRRDWFEPNERTKAWRTFRATLNIER